MCLNAERYKVVNTPRCEDAAARENDDSFPFFPVVFQIAGNWAKAKAPHCVGSHLGQFLCSGKSLSGLSTLWLTIMNILHKNWKYEQKWTAGVHIW